MSGYVGNSPRCLWARRSLSLVRVVSLQGSEPDGGENARDQIVALL